MSDSIIPLKKCTKCGEEKPYTAEYFKRDKYYKSGLSSQCRQCSRQYFHDNHDKVAIQRRHYRMSNHEKIAESARQYRLENADKLAEYRQQHREQKVEYDHRYYLTNREQINKRDGEYRIENAEHLAEYQRRYRRMNPHMRSAAEHRCRARKHSLPNTWTGQHWLLCLGYWHNTCAVCRGQLRGLFDIEPHADHWIPLVSSDCPGTTPDNMICLCNKCNLTKHYKSPKQWLISRYGKRKAAEILKRIEAYFEWIRHQ